MVPATAVGIAFFQYLPCDSESYRLDSPGALNYAALRLDVAPAEVHRVASFYGMFSLEPRPLVVAHICDDIACFTRGSQSFARNLKARFDQQLFLALMGVLFGYAANVSAYASALLPR